MKIAQRREASVEVRKFSFVYSHNSHLVWEWSNVNYKANLVTWKNYMLNAFRDENYQAYFIFILRSKRSISIGIERGKNLESFETLRLNGDFQPKWIAHVMWRVHDLEQPGPGDLWSSSGVCSLVIMKWWYSKESIFAGTTLFSLNVSSKGFFYESLRGLERLSAAQSCHGLHIFNPPFYVRFFLFLFYLLCFALHHWI